MAWVVPRFEEPKERRHIVRLGGGWDVAEVGAGDMNVACVAFCFGLAYCRLVPLALKVGLQHERHTSLYDIDTSGLPGICLVITPSGAGGNPAYVPLRRTLQAAK